jgi:hypothetical protein
MEKRNVISLIYKLDSKVSVIFFTSVHMSN